MAWPTSSPLEGVSVSPTLNLRGQGVARARAHARGLRYSPMNEGRMKRVLAIPSVAIALCLIASPAANPQQADEAPAARPGLQAKATAGTFSGRYKLTIVFSRSCSMTVSGVTVLMDVVEAPVAQPPGVASPIAQGSEIFGQAATHDEGTVGRFVLLRQGDRLHGGFGTKDPGIQTLEGLRVSFRIAGTADTTTSALGRPQAQGTAIGDITLSRPTDEVPDSLGSCTARDHTWSLEPQ